MRYLKTLQMWDTGLQEAIKRGQLKIQVGQWVKCGPCEHKSRYVGHSKYTINVVHWQGSGKATNDLFKRRLKVKNFKNSIDKQN